MGQRGQGVTVVTTAIEGVGQREPLWELLETAGLPSQGVEGAGTHPQGVAGGVPPPGGGGGGGGQEPTGTTTGETLPPHRMTSHQGLEAHHPGATTGPHLVLVRRNGLKLSI